MDDKQSVLGALSGVLAVLAIIAGLFIVGFFILIGIALLNFGSNK